MNITILYGEGFKEKNGFKEKITEFSEKLKVQNKVNVFLLDEMNLKFCVGCWSCWWKTPGLCIHKDDASEIFKSCINSDFIIFSSPLNAGFISSSLKKITDRLIVLLHPYIQIIQNESHHKKRYEKYPDFGLLLQKEDETDIDDIEIIRNIYDRFSINFHCKQRFLKLIDDPNQQGLIESLNSLKL